MPAARHNDEASAVAKERSTTLEKVRLALRGLGFRDIEARRAVAAVASRHDPNEPIVLERVLREALTVATAA
jgi:Holliday junction resolvasome RuvABC DNA-binding subunit